jgi:hypothetical protein
MCYEAYLPLSKIHHSISPCFHHTTFSNPNGKNKLAKRKEQHNLVKFIDAETKPLLGKLRNAT